MSSARLQQTVHESTTDASLRLAGTVHPAGGTQRDQAIELALLGYYVVPLHWVDDGQCSCSDSKCDHAGKHPYGPLVRNGHKNSTRDTIRIREWWDRFPRCNIGIDLERSGVVVVGPDSPHWLAEFEKRGVPETMVVQTGGGAGHQHFFYRRTDNCPIARKCQSGEYDILSGGYVVAAGSATTNPYVLVTSMRAVKDLPIAPEWSVAMLGAATPHGCVAADEDSEPPVRLSEYAMQWWTGDKFANTPDGTIDRSRTLYAIAMELAKAGASKRTIVAALEDRDRTLAFPNGPKYFERPDAASRYLEMARKALRQIDGTLQTHGSADVDALIRQCAALTNEVQQLQTENRELREQRSVMFHVLRNPALKSKASTALAIVFYIMSAKDRHKEAYGWVRTPRAALAEIAGCSESTISNHLRVFERSGIINTRRIWMKREHVDESTGEIQSRPQSELHLRLVKSPDDTLRALMTLDPGRSNWGGKRQSKAKDHDDAVSHVETADVRTVQTVSSHDETLKSQVATQEGTPPPVEDVLSARILRLQNGDCLEPSAQIAPKVSKGTRHDGDAAGDMGT